MAASIPCALAATGSCCPDWAAASSQDKTRASDMAAYLIWAGSGRQFGLCPQLIRPCGDRCAGVSTYSAPSMGWTPLLLEGEWFNCIGGSGCQESCCRTCEIPLPGPVDSITEVKVDGMALDEETYRVDDAFRLVKTSGDCWPLCQDLSLPDSEENTFSVAYEQGIGLPAAGQRALDVLACEFLKLCTGASGCRLPSRWQSITREGITIEAADNLDALRMGRTDIYEVDAFLSATNPYGLFEAPYVHAIDGPKPPRQTTWP